MKRRLNRKGARLAGRMDALNAHADGERAALFDEPIDSCPYRANGPLRSLWLAGYEDCMSICDLDAHLASAEREVARLKEESPHAR